MIHLLTGFKVEEDHREPAILIVEDYQDLRHMLALQFEKAGFSVELSDGGKKAFALVQNLPFDAVLTDIEMPNGNGIELFRLIREWQLDLPVFLMTGGRNVKSLDPLVDEACGIFYKPFDPQTVIDTVRNFLLVKAEM